MQTAQPSFLGRGWQYRVYDLHNGRVRKVYHSVFMAHAVLFRDCFPYIAHPFWKFPGYARRCRDEALASLALVTKTTLPPSMLGNPTLLGALDYEQDKLISLKDVINRSSADEAHKIVDAFVQFTLVLIQHSLIDRNFNIGNNFALTAEGQIVLSDLGELCGDPRMIARHIASRPWASYDVTRVLPAHVRTYFVEEMDRALGAVLIEEGVDKERKS